MAAPSDNRLRRWMPPNGAPTRRRRHMAIQFDEYSGAAVLSPGGDLAGAEADELRTAVAGGVEARKVAGVVVDLSNARFIDSEGLEALLWTRRRCEDALGRPVKLAGLDANCRKILERTRVAHRFECRADLGDALR